MTVGSTGSTTKAQLHLCQADEEAVQIDQTLCSAWRTQAFFLIHVNVAACCILSNAD